MLLNILDNSENIYPIIVVCAVGLLMIWAFVMWLFIWIVGVDDYDETPATYLDWPEPDGEPIED